MLRDPLPTTFVPFQCLSLLHALPSPIQCPVDGGNRIRIKRFPAKITGACVLCPATLLLIPIRLKGTFDILGNNPLVYTDSNPRLVHPVAANTIRKAVPSPLVILMLPLSWSSARIETRWSPRDWVVRISICSGRPMPSSFTVSS